MSCDEWQLANNTALFLSPSLWHVNSNNTRKKKKLRKFKYFAVFKLWNLSQKRNSNFIHLFWKWLWNFLMTFSLFFESSSKASEDHWFTWIPSHCQEGWLEGGCWGAGALLFQSTVGKNHYVVRRWGFSWSLDMEKLWWLRLKILLMLSMPLKLRGLQAEEMKTLPKWQVSCSTPWYQCQNFPA